jgi:hypothetical protein
VENGESREPLPQLSATICIARNRETINNLRLKYARDVLSSISKSMISTLPNPPYSVNIENDEKPADEVSPPCCFSSYYMTANPIKMRAQTIQIGSTVRSLSLEDIVLTSLLARDASPWLEVDDSAPLLLKSPGTLSPSSSRRHFASWMAQS